jgi:protocatechuate 3,4-dioxygenase beta subunit
MSSRFIFILLALVLGGVGFWVWRLASEDLGPEFDPASEISEEDRKGSRSGARRREADDASNSTENDSGETATRRPLATGEGAEVRLRLIDEEGKPAAGVPAFLTIRRGAALRSAAVGDRVQEMSDEDGVVEFLGLEAPHRVELVLRSPRHVDIVHGLRLVPGERIDLGDQVLSPGGAVAGQVLDAAGAPAKGVEILAWSAGAAAAQGSAMAARAAALSLGMRDEDARRARSDEKGRYRIEGLAAGKALVRARPEVGPERERRDLDIAVGVTLDEVNFRLIEGWTLRGRVTRRDEVGIAKAELTLTKRSESAGLAAIFSGSASGARSKRTLSSADGVFVIEGLDPEVAYAIGASALGYVDQLRLPVPDQAEGETGAFTIALDPAPLVEVRVTDEGGEAFAEAFEISCDPGQAGGQQRPRAFYGKDAADLLGVALEPGLACIADVRTGMLRFEVTAAGRARATMTLRRLRSGDRKVVTVPLPPAIDIAGRVVDDLGDPIAGAQVVVSMVGASRGEFDEADALPRPERGGGVLGKILTDAEGRFSIGSIPAGRHLLRASHRAYSQPRAEAMDFNASRDDLELRLERAARIAGRVFDATGQALSGARVVLQREAAAGEARRMNRREAMADAEGRYAFERVKPGNYRLEPRAPGTGPRGRNPFERLDDASGGAKQKGVAVILGVAEDKQLDLHLRPSAAVKGRVLRGGQAVAGLTVELKAALREGVPEAIAKGVPGRRTRTDAEGRFHFFDVKTGAREVSLLVPGMSETPRQVVQVEGTNTSRADFDLPSGAVTGRLTDALTGTAIQGATVELRIPGATKAGAASESRRRAEGPLSEMGGGPRAPRSNAEGRFLIDYVPAGTYELWVRARGYEEPAPIAVTVTADRAEAVSVDVVLERGPVLSVQVNLSGEVPGGGLAAATIFVRDSTGAMRARRIGGIGRRVEIVDLDPGAYQLEVKVGSLSATRDVELLAGQRTELDIELN